MAGARGKPQDALSGAQKCAVLCLAVGTKEAATILQQLGSEEVEQVCREIASMSEVTAEMAQAVVQEFQSASQASTSITRGGVRYAQQVLEQAVGPVRAKIVLDKVQEQVVDTGLKRLKKVAPEVLVGILRGEHPQAIALILSHLDVRQSAAVVAAMDPGLAADVLYRVARMEKISPEMLAIVETGLSRKTDVSLSQEMTLSGGPGAVARMLNMAGVTLEKQLLEGLQQRNPDIAARVQSLMFVFEDLRLLDGASVQRLLREVDGKELALALKGASDQLKKHITAQMSERAVSALEEEIEMLGPVRVRDVEAVHTRILESVRALEEAGEIRLRGRGGDDDIIA